MNNLKLYRQNAGLSQGKLAELSEVSVRMIQHYEQGQKDMRKASCETVYKLAKVLNVSMEALLDYE